MALDLRENPMKKLDTYQNLCAEVYELSKPEAPPDAYHFYRSYALKAKGSILEPMCGTGRFLLPLVGEGFDVHGFDASVPMLERLHAKARAKDLKPRVWQGFIEDLNQETEHYSLIFIPSQLKSSLTLSLLILNPQRMILILFEPRTKQAMILIASASK